ncbi:MAG TPA: hypothetical protein VHC86_13425 [Opitutaceae bacterium]|nr:hypothetical protein [Opitutaceae bacterium]
MKNKIIVLLPSLIASAVLSAQPAPPAETTQPGTAAEPVRILHHEVNLDAHDGGLTPVMGVETIQVLRANRTHPEWADNFGFTYNHAPMIAYWNNKFYLEYLSNTYGEQVAPGHTLVATSADGRTWSKPQEVFPIYFLDVPPFRNMVGEPGTAIMHQRMGFYVAPNGRLLVCAFYGGTPSPFGPGGIGRVVREAYKDGSYGPIYFIKYNQHYRHVDSDQRIQTAELAKAQGWNEQNTSRPFSPGGAPMPVLYYKHSPDQGFIAACDALLNDRLKTMQWWEEEGDPSTLFKGPNGRLRRFEAPSVYHRKDGVAVSLWKWSGAGLSTDEGKTWTNVVPMPTIVTAGAKVWGQKTADGRYAIVYNPANDGYHRWPLALATSDDGIVFDRLLLVDGEIAPRRYMGRAKDFGLQYIRGISEGNGTPPGTDMWLTYSTKEDIWVTRVPVPIRYQAEGPVSDSFDQVEVDGKVPDWNIRRGQWAPVGVVAFPSAEDRSLQLADRDPYDYARAERVFAEGPSPRISFKVYPHQADTGRLEVDVLDHSGRRPVRIAFGEDGHIRAMDGAASVDAGTYAANAWCTLDITVDSAAGKYDLSIDGKMAASRAAFAEAATSVNRLAFRTGSFRTEPTRHTSRDIGGRDVENPGEPVAMAAFNLDNVTVK